ncbi:FAD:protein FMN transferase [Streptomyces longispororuber]|uniref:FAD:protein FMN transferase n=1 Tax=Streptomyces longispororuber TaxID=68230 RepID=UPI00210A2BF0|nr:FAD:protein FMN transferase [Streptomyces longispororuber]MCQ4205707.1 FAD:protein FMN transferase [Streptomyces longispororuber]
MADPTALHRVVHTMGTVFSLTVRDAPTPRLRSALDDVENLLHHVDAVFSPFRSDSAVCRIRRGEPVPHRWDGEVQEVLTMCTDAENRTGGWFSSRHSGAFDPSGLVKGWAVERAARLLRAAGAGHLCLNGGGDVQLHGGPWRVGISHPLAPGLLAARVESAAGPLAVATSGPAERGCHIVDPHTGEPPRHGLASLTVVSTSLTEADVAATSAYAMGGDARAWLEELPGVTAFAVEMDGSTWMTGHAAGSCQVQRR